MVLILNFQSVISKVNFKSAENCTQKINHMFKLLLTNWDMLVSSSTAIILAIFTSPVEIGWQFTHVHILMRTWVGPTKIK